MDVQQSPTVVVADPNLEAETLVGYVDAATINQAVVDALRHSGGMFTSSYLRAVDKVCWQHGTAMQLAGWDALRRIPPGAPLTYTGFAAELGAPTAVRAAASVCARNAVALFVPCHRVLRGDGTLGGFAWGSDVKRRLLSRERGE